MKSDYWPRLMEGMLERRLAEFPVVVVTGARQTGKTTLVRRLPSSAGRLYRTLDDSGSLELAERDPQPLLTEAPRLTIAEVQRVPELLPAIKREVDRDRKAGRFLLTGSANLLLMAQVSESLAGRAVYLFLRPLTESEKAGAPTPGPWEDLLAARSSRDALDALNRKAAGPCPWARSILQGGFPSAVKMADPGDRRAWHEGYVQTYVERDLRQLAQIDNLVDFRRLMRIAALRVGRLANQAEMARDAGLSHATAHRYLNLLETSFLIARIPPYSVSRTKRLMKTPKLYWADPGLAAFLTGIETERDLRSHECAGGLLENLVWHHLQSGCDVAPKRTDALTWRTAAGEEVDFVLERGSRLLPVEVKSASGVNMNDVRHLASFLDEYEGRAPFGVVLYNGRDCRLVAERIIALPLALALAVA